MIALCWPGARRKTERRCGGRLIETVPATLVRPEALAESGLHRLEMYPPYEVWHVANAVRWFRVSTT